MQKVVNVRQTINHKVKMRVKYLGHYHKNDNKNFIQDIKSLNRRKRTKYSVRRPKSKLKRDKNWLSMQLSNQI